MSLLLTRAGSSEASGGGSFIVDSRTADTILGLSPKLWLDAYYIYKGITASGYRSTVLPDLSGNNFHFYQWLFPKQPLIVPNGKNSKPVIRFDGTDDIMQRSGSVDDFKFMHTGASTTFIVFKPWTVADPNTFSYLLDNVTSSGSIGSRNGFYLGPDDRASSSFNDNIISVVSNNGGGGVNVIGTTTSNGVAPANTWSIDCIQLDPSNATAANRLYISRNAGTVYQGNTTSGSVGSGSATYRLALGGTGGDLANNFTGDVASIVMFPSLLSAGDVTTVMGILNSNWGVY